jgi:hypothetical protein
MNLEQGQVDAMGGCAPCRFEPMPPESTPAPPADGPPPRSVIMVDPTKADTFVGIELLDPDKKPVPYQRFVVTPPGMAPIEGTLDVNGRVRIEGINPGTCTVVFPNIDRRDFA